MPKIFGVLKAWHPMIGVDFHIPWPPGSPAPLPVPAPYRTYSVMYGTGITCRYTTTVCTDGLAPAMVRGTDIGPCIFHVGPPSITIMLEFALSGSKSHFGASSVLVKDQHGAGGPIAAALLFSVNPNLNCGIPIPTPTGAVLALTTHFVGMTAGDVLAGRLLMEWDMMFQAILAKFGGVLSTWIGKAAGRIASRLGISTLGRVAARQAARAMGVRSNIGPTARMLQQQARDRLAAFIRNAQNYGPVLPGLGIGSPLGMSLSSVSHDEQGNPSAPSLYDRFANWANPEKWADDQGKALDKFLTSPSVEEIP